MLFLKSVSHIPPTAANQSVLKLNTISLVKYVTRKPKIFFKCQREEKFVIPKTNSLPPKKKILKDLC